MAVRDRPPTFEATRPHGARSAVELHRFDLAHPRARLGPHDHRDLEVLFFEQDGGTHRVGGRSLPARAGDVVVVAPRQPHDLGDVGEAWGWALEFSPQDLRGLEQAREPLAVWRSNPLLNPFLAAELDPDDGVFQLDAAQRVEWSARMHRLERELTERPTGHDEAVAALLMLVLVDLARMAQDVAGLLRHRDEPVLAAVFDLIEDRFDTDLSLGEVAEALGYSAAYLTGAVRERTGRTVVDWITQRRMTEARKLLLETDLPQQVIATRCGFRDPAYFSRRFRQVHGTNPRAWRAAATP